MSPTSLTSLIEAVEQIPDTTVYGRVGSVLGMMLEVGGIERLLSIGDRVQVVARGGHRVACEVVGFRGDRALVLPFGSTEGVGLGGRAFVGERQPALWPTDAWLGRVINALGEPIDGKGPLPVGAAPASLRAKPPPAQTRDRVGGKIDLGVRALNTFVSCCRGQRMGIFAGSGVGKSVMMAMMARYTEADVNVIGLVGERGREVQEFIQDDLGEEGLARSVVVVATSDESPLMRRQAAYATLAVAEHFRDRGSHVLCMIDSITRFAMSQREIGLSVGEPPTSKGYPPTTFAELPRLLERAGPGTGNGGAITGLFTVLVDGDDHNEPIADAVRSILDGHIVLERGIAERGRYPAINVLKSVSRTMPNCNSDWENLLVRRAKQLLSTYDDMAEMIRLGAYRKGTDAEVDRSIEVFPAMEDFLSQNKTESTDLATGYRTLSEILNEPELAPPDGA